MSEPSPVGTPLQGKMLAVVFYHLQTCLGFFASVAFETCGRAKQAIIGVCTGVFSLRHDTDVVPVLPARLSGARDARHRLHQPFLRRGVML